MSPTTDAEQVGHTPGPWAIWEGPSYVGGGADLCIGAGKKWLANMDHRERRCPQVLDPDGHFDDESCDICTIDAPRITAEQRANARLIAAAPDLLAACRAIDAHLSTTFPPYAPGDSPYDKVRAAIAKATETP